jgi:hypothetical protein
MPAIGTNMATKISGPINICLEDMTPTDEKGLQLSKKFCRK